VTDRPLWAGRFATGPAPEAHALGRSLGFDVRLAPYDVRCGLAHVQTLRAAGLLAGDEAAALRDALEAVGREIAEGTFAFSPSDEDVHSAIERGVTERLGDLGARLHAGRSRNDLVAADTRLWMLDAAARIDGGAARLAGALVARAREHAGTLMPGTTHGRNAQPITLGHHLLAHAWALVRDRVRRAQWATRTSASPLGAGALATSTLGLDPALAAAELGFERPFENSIDAVADRDAVLEFLAWTGILSVHGARLGADLVRWTDPSLGWASLDESFATGSSMMPQKRNPDAAELARGKAARVASGYARLAAVLAPLPLGYHRDLQEDKEPAFDAADTLELVLPALAGAVATIRFHHHEMRAALDDEGLYATDLAEALVHAGVPFREAHRRTGELLRRVEEEGRPLRDLDAGDWEAFGVDGRALLDPGRAVAARSGPGGPATDSVLVQATAIERALAAQT
jgi:argininosuccinate lyase